MLHKRLLAAATATFLALGLAVGGASPAMAAPPADNAPAVVCDDLGYDKPDELDSIPDDSSGSYEAPFGTISWSGTEVTVVVDEGYTAEICIKGGSDDPLESGVLEAGTHTLDKGKLSHIGFTYDEVDEPGLATASIDVTGPNCFSGELLNEGGFGGDNSSYDIVDDGSGDGTYEVIFTADEGFEFENGETTQSFTGTLAPALEGEECTLGLAQASLEFTAATCLDPEQLSEPGVGQLENAEVLDFTVNEDGSFEVVFGLADGGDAFDTNQTDFVFGDYDKSVTASYNDDNTELTLSGMLDGPNEELCSDEIVTTTDPSQVNTCDVQSYTITASEGVEYTVVVNDGEPTVVDFGDESSATFDAETFDTVVITAAVLDGYAFEEGTITEWTFEFPLADDCFPTFPVTTASVTSTQPDCLGNPGSYTLTNEPGVIWTVDGVVVEGNSTYTAAIGSTPSIEASLEGPSDEFPGGYGWNDEDPQTLWNLSFAAADDCLPTLAVTGASNAIGGLGTFAALIMMVGAGFVVAQRRQAARVQG